MGKTIRYDHKLAEEICEKISEGGNIKEVLKSRRFYPSFVTWCKWKREHPDLQRMYHGAIQDKSEGIIEEIEDTMHKIKTKQMSAHEGKVIINALQWQAAKYYPKMFGDKVDVTSDGEKIQNLSKEEIKHQIDTILSNAKSLT